MNDPLLNDPDRPIKDIKFRGRIFPWLGFPLSIQGMELGFTSDDGNHVVVIINLENHSVEVTARTQSDDLLTIRNHVQQLVESVVDLIAYMNNCWFEIHIDSYEIDGTERQMNSYFDGLRFVTHPINEFSAAYKIAAQMPCLRRALSDIRQAMKKALDTGFHCFRAIEDLRQFFFNGDPNNSNDKKRSWDKLNSELRIDQTLSKFVEKYGTPQRHGQLVNMSAVERDQVLKVTMQIIDRFCIYAANGFEALPPEKYDVLRLPDVES